MAKRLTDTGKWNKPFVRSLQAPYKLLWFYILDECDHAGIWQVDEDVAKIRIGCGVDFNEAQKVFKNHIQIFDDGQKWFIPDFIDFQYGELNPANKVHLSVLTIHKKYKIKPLGSPLKGAMEKDKEKEKDKEDARTEFEKVFDEFLEMRRKIRKPATPKAVELIMADLETLAPGNTDKKIKILEQSIKKCWQGVFEIKGPASKVYVQPEDKEY